MAFLPDQVDHNLSLLGELLSCGSQVFLWSYDAEGRLLASNCQDAILNTIFERIGASAYMIEFGRTHTRPLLLGAPLGLMWCAAFEYQDGSLYRSHLIGPVFNTEITQHALEEQFKQYEISVSFKIRIFNVLPTLPILSTVLMLQYGLMLHYCVTGEKLQRSDIEMQQADLANTRRSLKPEYIPRDRHKVYEGERALLRMVREGDLDYRKVLEKATQLSPGVRVSNGQPVMQALVTGVTFAALCTRAAIEGGLSPDAAYTVGDGYVQSMIQCDNVAEMGSLINTMYADFIERVHKSRQNPAISPLVRRCCDYIELHLEEPLTLAVLAKEMGYTEYYLSRRFKQEMKVNINEYVRFARIERAKTLLEASELSVAEVAARLQFCSGSHFSQVFQQVAGCTPRQWRGKNSANT